MVRNSLIYYSFCAVVKDQIYLLWDVDGLHHLCTQHLLPTPNQILKEVDGNVIVGWKVDADVSGEEVIDLALASIFGRELLRCDLRCGWLANVHRLHWLVVAIHLTVFL